MKINKGLIRDLSYIDQQVGTWRGGKNFIIDNGNIKSEKGFEEYQVLNNAIIGVGTLANIIIICSIKYTNDVYDYSEIGIIVDDVYISKLQNADLNFNISYPIIIEAKYNYLGEIVIALTDNYNKPRLINLNNIPLGLANNITLINLFGSYKVPIFTLNGVDTSSGLLYSGIYYVAIQYALSDKSYSHSSRLSNPIQISKDNISKVWNMFGSCEAGTLTNKIIDLTINNVDINYNYARIVIVHRTDSEINAYIGEDLSVSPVMNIIISDISTYTITTLSDVITPTVEYSKVGAMTALDNVLYLANLTKDEDIKYQKYANNIEVEWVYTNEVALNNTKYSYKDPVILFDKKGFMPDEVYALYIRFIKNDGTKVTNAALISGRDSNPTDKDAGSLVAQTIYPEAKKFHFENTATSNGDGTGKMGYWENIGDSYSNDDEYNGQVDYDGLGIVGRDLRGTPVKHHKFPSIPYLMSLGIDYYPTRYNSITEAENYLNMLSPSIFPTSLVGIETIYCKFLNITSNIGSSTFANNTTTYINDTLEDISNLSLTYNLASFMSSPYIPPQNEQWRGKFQFIINIYVKDTLGNITRSHVNTSTGGTGEDDITLHLDGVLSNIILPINYTIEIKIEAYATEALQGTSFDNINFDTSYINILSTLDAQGDVTYGKTLGIKVSNIVIPDYISEQCSHFEILYAKRTTANMTVIGNGILTGKAINLVGDTVYPRHSFYSYDILSQKLDIPITHLTLDWEYINKKLSNGGTDLDFDYQSMTYITGGDIEASPFTQANRLIKSSGSSIVQYNQPYGEYDNTNMSESLYIDYIDTDLPRYATGLNVKNIYKSVTPLIANACSFKTKLYSTFYNQELVTTGTILSLTDNIIEGVITTPIIQGGDVVYTLYGATVIYENTISYILAPIYNILNSGLRYNINEDILTTFFPDFNLIWNINSPEMSDGVSDNNTNFSGVPNVLSTSRWTEIKDLLVIDNVVDFPEVYNLNLTDAYVNDLVIGLIFNPNNDFTNIYKYRIHRGLVSGTETISDGWRNFKTSNYYDSENNRGEIYALETEGADLLILHSSTLFVAQHKDVLNMTNDVAVALGQADIFGTKPIEIVPSETGYVGCQSRFAITKFVGGITIIDRQQRKIFIYNNRQVEEISNYGMKEFFIENLQYVDYPTGAIIPIIFDDLTQVTFDDGTGAITSNTEITSEINSNVDNPFANKGITSTYDKRYNRLIFTKNHKEIINQGEVDEELIDGSFTLSYYPALKAWAFFHDYIPNYYFTSRLNTFATIDNKLYKLNKGAIANYGTGINSSYIDIIWSDNRNIDKHFLSLIWSTIFRDDSDYISKLKTFQKVIVYNQDRYSGEITLTNYTFGSEGNIRLTSDSWKFNAFRDLVQDKNVKILDKNNIDELLVDDTILDTVNWYDKHMFISPYIIVRFVFDNALGSSIELLNVEVNLKEVVR